MLDECEYYLENSKEAFRQFYIFHFLKLTQCYKHVIQKTQTPTTPLRAFLEYLCN